jgi:hypothetical protein
MALLPSILFIYFSLAVANPGHIPAPDELFLPQATEAKNISKPISIKISKLESMSVSSLCFEGREACLSLIKKMTVFEKEGHRKPGDPAANFCEDNHGILFILSDKQGQQYNFCQIHPTFFVDAWDLYSHKEKLKAP